MRRSRSSRSIWTLPALPDDLMANRAPVDELVDALPCGIVSFTDEGRILFANRTLATLLGYEPDDLPGRHVESLLTVAGRIFYQTHFFPLLRLHGKAEEVFLSLRAKSGAEVPVLANAKRRAREG